MVPNTERMCKFVLDPGSFDPKDRKQYDVDYMSEFVNEGERTRISILKKGDITLIEAVYDDDQSGRIYSVWMDHAAFTIYKFRELEGTSFTEPRLALLTGDFSNKRPPQLPAIWTGVMVGTPALGEENSGNILQRDALLEYSFTTSTGSLTSATLAISRILITKRTIQ